MFCEKYLCRKLEKVFASFCVQMSVVLGFRNGAESTRIANAQNLRESHTQKLRESRFCLFSYFLDSTKPTNRTAFVTCARIQPAHALASPARIHHQAKRLYALISPPLI